jgi:aminoglycoside/choline kinase family phosphotransferase
VDLNAESRLVLCRQWLMGLFKLTELTLTVVSGDAGFRRYYRFEHQNQTLIAVDAPPQTEDNQLFVELSQAYAERGLLAPKVVAFDLAQGFMCLSDLGDELLLSALNPTSVDKYYQQALALLPQIAQITGTARGPLPSYDATRLSDEMNLFIEWFLPRHLDFTPDAAQCQMMEKAFAAITNNAVTQPQVAVHRDFHSRNLMITEDDQLSVIDYQGALLGGVTYDPASLLRDCYIQWPDEVVYGHLLAYKQLIGDSVAAVKEVSDETFIRWFDLMGMQRHIKVCGIFCRLYYRDGKAGYLDDIPLTLDYVIGAAKKYPEFADFAELLEMHIRPLLVAKVKKKVKEKTMEKAN